MYLVDSHCHLDGLNYETLHDGVDSVLADARARGVGFVLAVATTLPGYRSMRERIGERRDVAFSCGVHPLNLDGGYDSEALRSLAAQPGVVALGRPGSTTTTSRIISRCSRRRFASISASAVRWGNR